MLLSRQLENTPFTQRALFAVASTLAAVCCVAFRSAGVDDWGLKGKNTSRPTVAFAVLAPDTLLLAFASAPVLITTLRVESTELVDSIVADSAKLVELGLARLEGAQLQVRVRLGQTVRANAQFVFGFLQYLTDDQPARDLQFRYRTKWVPIPTSGSTLRLPTFLNPDEGAPDLSRLLGYADRDALASILGRRFFATLSRQSLDLQSAFYRKLLRDSAVAACCPEYIVQANKFLSKHSADFRTPADLGLELSHRDTLLRLEILTGDRVDATLILLIVPVDR